MGNDRQTSVYLVDDHAVVRMGYRALLQQEPEVRVIGEAGSGEKALAEIQNQHPDVAVVDISMHGMDGLELTRRLKRDLADLQILIVSIHDSPSFVERAREAGADGYIPKGKADSLLAEGVEVVNRGESFYRLD